MHVPLLTITNMKKLNNILRKCKTFSKQMSRTLSYNGLRSKSNRDHGFQELWDTGHDHDHHLEEPCETIFVGSSRKRYEISSKHLNHPLLNALIEKSNEQAGLGRGRDHDLLVKCEVVLFDHLLWMLDNADPTLTLESLEELAELYAY